MQGIAEESYEIRVKPLYFTLNGAVTWFTSDDKRPMFYLACGVCKKKVTEQHGVGFRCEGCGQTYKEAVPTYNFSFKFSDYSTSMYLSCLGDCGE